ncbi:hypothetical protein ACODT5_43605 [Streptomyces sp. 5.8]|uniref:hypothetical protein n=1 Tax=Streptomyces sp. 5.8 TaxID=3406571 RepID=UPI003BB728E5
MHMLKLLPLLLVVIAALFLIKRLPDIARRRQRNVSRQTAAPSRREVAHSRHAAITAVALAVTALTVLGIVALLVV